MLEFAHPIKSIVATRITLSNPLTERRMHRTPFSSLRDRFWRYFSGSVVGESEACKGKQSLFCLTPHGVFPFGVALASLGRCVGVCLGAQMYAVEVGTPGEAGVV